MFKGIFIDNRKFQDDLIYSSYLFQRIKSSDISLASGLYPDKLQKLITNPNSENELRAGARVLMTSLIQKKLNEMKQKYGVEMVQTFLEENTKNIKNRLENPNQKKTKTKTKGTKKAKKEPESDESDFIEEPESESDDEESPEAVGDEVQVKKPKEVKSKKTKPQEKAKKEKNPAKKHKKNETTFQKSVDSFFMVADGENYLASVGATVSSDDENEEKVDKQKSKKHPVKLGGAKKYKDLPAKPKAKTFTANAVTKPIPAVVPEPELHPSWRAKTQLRIDSQIKDFQGTKIKFD